MTLVLKRSSSNGVHYVQICDNIKRSSFQRSYFSTFFRGKNCVKPSLPQQIKSLNMQGNWISLQGKNALPHMSFSAHSGVAYLSLGTLVWDLVSSAGLHYSKSKGNRNLFVIRFQVKGAVFAQGTDISGDSILRTTFQKGVFWRSRGRSSESFSECRHKNNLLSINWNFS